MYKTGIKILETKVGILSNKKSLLLQFPLKVEPKSLLTDFHQVEEIPYSSELDGYISIGDKPGRRFHYEFSPEKVIFRGAFLRLSREASDLRYSFWGNQGFLYRYILFLSEKKHRVYNFHACGLFHKDQNRLYVIVGGAGSGKTIYLLSGLSKGLKLFSTETVHFRIENEDISWFMGSLVDNVRLGALRHNFPQFLSPEELPESADEWQKKIAVDLSSYKNDLETLINPEVVILFPRIEEGREGFILTPIEDKRKGAKAIFDNISQKLSETVILYDKIPVAALDNRELALARLECTNQLVHHQTISQMAFILSNPYQCWGSFLG